MAFPIRGGFAVQGLVKVSGNFVVTFDSLTLVVSVLSEITQIDFSASVTSEGSLTENGHGHFSFLHMITTSLLSASTFSFFTFDFNPFQAHCGQYLGGLEGSKSKSGIFRLSFASL